MTYAAQTSVSVEKSKAEIERLLLRNGADQTLFHQDRQGSMIQFEIGNRILRFTLPLPSRDGKEFRYTPSKKRRRTDAQTFDAWEQACRQRWRALLLIIKAKFEAISAGILTFDEVFLAHILLPTKQTVGEFFVPQIEAVYTDGAQPLMLPGLPQIQGEG